ncbi:UNVERIFIED_CONTAM: hypothetical protein GTU68_064379 [Idotea baltica]|nr:hypothetical protein [Idotea baltica]
MGTTYNITAIGAELDEGALSTAVEESLAAVNASMSNWDPNSEVSVFSATADTAPVPISPEFATVMSAANLVHEKSGGRFDVTLGPLIELWGFGPRKPDDPVPSDGAIAEALTQVGQAKLLVLNAAAGTMAKSDPAVGINLGAIAKGYGVDAVAEVLQGFGSKDYMVEIGGDLVTSGTNDQREPWRIGIEKPEIGAQGVELILPISDLGLATSGDYRNFFEHDGVRLSHILDPVTGRPIIHNTTSVTVVTDTEAIDGRCLGRDCDAGYGARRRVLEPLKNISWQFSSISRGCHGRREMAIVSARQRLSPRCLRRSNAACLHCSGFAACWRYVHGWHVAGA